MTCLVLQNVLRPAPLCDRTAVVLDIHFFSAQLTYPTLSNVAAKKRCINMR